jgi:hypothetical protein
MAHIMLHTGLPSKEKDCLALKCVFDSGAALSTTNFHFMEAVISQFPQILKKIYLPDNYVAIILSSIVNTLDSTPITTKLNIGLDIHLPYTTKDGSYTSLLVAAGLDVAFNLILGLPFIKATGMIADFVDNVCEAKNLLCILFPLISNALQNQSLFFRKAKQHPSFTTRRCSTLYTSLVCSKHSMHAKMLMANGFISSSHPRRVQKIPINVRPHPLGVSLVTGWYDLAIIGFPPATLVDDTVDYHNQVLGDLGYL